VDARPGEIDAAIVERHAIYRVQAGGERHRALGAARRLPDGSDARRVPRRRAARGHEVVRADLRHAEVAGVRRPARQGTTDLADGMRAVPLEAALVTASGVHRADARCVPLGGAASEARHLLADGGNARIARGVESDPRDALVVSTRGAAR